MNKKLIGLIAVSVSLNSLYAMPYTDLLPFLKVDKRVEIKETKVVENHPYFNCDFKFKKEDVKCNENPIVINDYISGKDIDIVSDNYNPDTNAIYMDKENHKCFMLEPVKACSVEQAKDFVTETRMYKHVAYNDGYAYSTYDKEKKSFLREKPPYVEVYGLKYSEEKRKLIK